MINEQIESLASLPDIPGMHISVDGRKHEMRIFDPLSRPEWAEFESTLKEFFKARFNELSRPEKEIVVVDATNTDIKTWLYWLRRMATGRPVEPEEFKPRGRFDSLWNDPTRGVINQTGPVPTAGGHVPMARVVQGTLPTMKDIMDLPGKTGISQHDSSQVGKYRFLEDHPEYRRSLDAVD